MKGELPEVGGRRLEGTLWGFETSCRVLIRDEQEKASPNNALIGVLCNAVRLAREHEDLAKGRIR